jgi:Flp pilus assembly protein TadD
MDPTNGGESGHYGALGVSTKASQRQIEVTFRRWKDRHRAGAENIDAYRRAESAYHVLCVPESRARHDRQLGLVAHPAWAAGRDRAVRECTRRALRELGQGHAGQARKLLDRAVSLAPEDPHARSYLALALARSGGCLHEAARHARYALSRRPREAAFFFNLAEVYATAGLRARACALRARGWHAIVGSVIASFAKKME